MKKTLYTALLITAISLTTPAQAFDIGGLVTSAIKDAVKEEVTSATKDATSSAVKGAANAAGIEGADKYIDYATENAAGIQGQAAGVGALGNMAGSGGIAGASAALNGAAIARNQARILNGNGTPADAYRQEYLAISHKMGNCGADNACIQKYQAQLIALQKRGNAYVAKTGDADYNGTVNSVDTRVNEINKQAEKAMKSIRPSSGGYNE